MERVFLASEAIAELDDYRYSPVEKIPTELLDQLSDNVEALMSLHGQLLPKVDISENSARTSKALFESILETNENDSEEAIVLRALANLASEPVERELKDDPALFSSLRSSDQSKQLSAREEVISRYGNFVRSRANKIYYSLPKKPGVDYDDLVQEGMMSLLARAEKFIQNGRSTFLNYAGQWIYHRMKRYYQSEGTSVHVPDNVQLKLSRVRQENARRQNLRLPMLDTTGIAELAEVEDRLEISTNPGTPLTVGNILLAEMLTTYMGSTDGGYSPKEMGPDNDYIVDGRSELDNVTDHNTPRAVEDEATRFEISEIVRQSVAELDMRSREVVSLRFGLADGKVRTLEEVGSILGITREKVRHIEARALANLSHPELERSVKQRLRGLVSEVVS